MENTKLLTTAKWERCQTHFQNMFSPPARTPPRRRIMFLQRAGIENTNNSNRSGVQF